jgi:acetyl-CoA carboxylase carboxyltransferase component
VSWKEEVEGIEARARLSKQHGGPEAVEAQRSKGRGTIRERIDGLIDPGSFRETGPLAGHGETDESGNLISFEPANYVLGIARIDGRPCVVGGEDFTLKGGSPNAAGLRKSVFSEELACRYRLPLIRFLEGGGGSVAGTGSRSRAPVVMDAVNAPPRFASFVEAMATVPVVSAAMGPVAGFPAARLVASHFSVMTRHTSQVLVGGPALVERATGEKLTKEELGGAAVHGSTGVVDCVVDDEEGVHPAMRRFLSYLPTNVWEAAPVLPCDDPPDRTEEKLLEIVPRDRRKVYKVRRLIELVVDRGSFFEIGELHGRTQVTGFARLAGRPVGVLANDPNYYAGAMTADGAQKVRRFVDLCDTFHLPIVSLVDEPGFMIGSAAERAATIRHGAATLFAVMQSTVPWASVIVRKTYGVAAAAHFGPRGYVVAWPSLEGGPLPLEGGVAVAFRREIESAPDPAAKRRELEERMAARRTPFPRAEAFGLHDLIDPRRTRPVLCDWLDWIQPLLAEHRGPRSYSIRP